MSPYCQYCGRNHSSKHSCSEQEWEAKLRLTRAPQSAIGRLNDAIVSWSMPGIKALGWKGMYR